MTTYPEIQQIEEMAGRLADAAAVDLNGQEQDQLRRAFRNLQNAVSGTPDWRPGLLIAAVLDGLTEFACEQCDDHALKGGNDLPVGWEYRPDPTATDGRLLFCAKCIEEGSRYPF